MPRRSPEFRPVGIHVLALAQVTVAVVAMLLAGAWWSLVLEPIHSQQLAAWYDIPAAALAAALVVGGSLLTAVVLWRGESWAWWLGAFWPLTLLAAAGAAAWLLDWQTLAMLLGLSVRSEPTLRVTTWCVLGGIAGGSLVALAYYLREPTFDYFGLGGDARWGMLCEAGLPALLVVAASVLGILPLARQQTERLPIANRLNQPTQEVIQIDDYLAPERPPAGPPQAPAVARGRR